MKQREAIRSEKSADLADADRENSSRRSNSGNQDCCVGYACWAHMSILVSSVTHYPRLDEIQAAALRGANVENSRSDQV
jgi:hypothetical protein